MNCANCGAAQEDGALFCKKCGTKVEKNAQSLAPRNSPDGSARGHIPVPAFMKDGATPAAPSKKPTGASGWIATAIILVALSTYGAFQDEWDTKKAKEDSAEVFESVIRNEPVKEGDSASTAKYKILVKDIFDEYGASLREATVAVTRVADNPRLMTYESFTTISEMESIVADLNLAIQELEAAPALYAATGSRVEQKINASSLPSDEKQALIEGFKKSYQEPTRTAYRDKIDADGIAVFRITKQIYELLISNFDDYELDSEGIYFQTDSVMNRYNDLLDRHTAASDKYLADNAEFERYQAEFFQSLGTDVTSDEIQQYMYGQQ